MGCDERVKVANSGPENRSYNDIFVIVSYRYKNEVFLLLNYIPFNFYADIGIWNLLCEDMRFEIDEMFVRLDVMVLIIFILCYVQASSCLFRNRRDS